MNLHWVRDNSIKSTSYYFSSAIEKYLSNVKFYSPSETHPLLLKDGINIYSIEDTIHAHFARSLAGTFPGLSIIHNYYLTTRIFEALHNSPWRKNINDLHEQNIKWLGRDNKYEESRTEALREASISYLSAFTSPRDRECFIGNKKETVTGETVYIPFPVSDIHLKKVTNKSKKIAVISGVNMEWHPHVWIQALPQKIPVTWLVKEHDLERAHEIVRDFNKNISIHVCRTPDDWRAVLEDGPLVIHPLFSGYHSLSPYLEMSIASGARVIAQDFGYPRYFPDSLLYRVPMGREEVSYYTSLFQYLLNDAESDRLSDIRHEYMLTHHSAESVAKVFMLAVKKQEELKKIHQANWNALYGASQKEVMRVAVSDPVLMPACQELMSKSLSII